MSNSNERYVYFLILISAIIACFVLLRKQQEDTQAQLTTYQDSVNVLIQVNKKLHAAQTMYSDAIVFVMGVKPTDFDELRQRYEDASRWAATETNKKFMTLQEVEHGKD